MNLTLRRLAALARFAFAFLLVASTIAGLQAPAAAVGGVSGTINGFVTDSATNAPLPNVVVTASAPSQTSHTSTDAKGFFTFNGLPVDTYTVSFALKGYQGYATAGLTVQGDQQVSASVALSRALQTIGRTQSRAASSAFQPKQTTDSYQVSGAQVATALGRAGNISQTQLQSSVPSVTTTIYGSSSIRGSTRTEIAYQFDGIDYTDPLSSQFQNSLALNGLQALQVNPGAGDASQGNAGAGAVNIVVKRGTRPSFNNLYVEESGYPFGHYASFEYGWATPDGKISNYSTFVGQTSANQYGFIGAPAYTNGSFLSADFGVTRDFINNFVYKFAHDNSRSLQFLYQTRYSDFMYNHGGIANLCYKTCDPNIAGTPTLGGQLDSSSYFPGLSVAQRFADEQAIIGLLPGQYSPQQKIGYQGFNHQPVDVLKLEFSQQLDATTYWTNRVYRVQGNAVFNRPYDTQTTSSRVNQAQGGTRNGLAGDLVKQFGSKHQVDLNYTYQAVHPVYDYVSNTLGYRALNPAQGNAGGYELADFIAPTNGALCPGTDANGNSLMPIPSLGGSRCGYLAQYFPGGIPRVPNFFNTSSGDQHLFGFGLRDQFTVSPQLKLDYGIRQDGSDYQILNDPGYITRETKHPRVTQPRFAAAYQMGTRDAVRFSYGRSVQFTPAGTLNSPVLYASYLQNIPSYDNTKGYDASGNPIPSMRCGAPLFVSQCKNYAQQIHDEQVAFFGLEAFNVKP
ncbi:MAG: carboxypeptidase regulatory-like domain-containing protein, partial [Candidatus Eremiobacteraeota bacterium]|nr:carboxypeptidase regulatory-like domain-containing protein [Candidatus Eremiobacteraeota bacterium]